MTAEVHHPISLPAVRLAGARTFAILYTLESFARASVSSVIPIQAYEILKDKQGVSLLYTIVAMIGLSATLFMPMLIERFSRRWVYTMGVCALAVGSACLLTQSLVGQVVGMVIRLMGAGALAITLSLYIMDHIKKADFIQAESLRMASSTVAWAAGPTLGVFLYTQFGIAAAHGAVAVFCTVLLALFWYFRLSDNVAIRPGKTHAANPLASVGRFVKQPRLRLAWVIAFGRSCFWSTFYIYGPILMVATGQGKLAGGLVVSVGNIMVATALIWGRVGKRFGARNTMAVCFFALTASLFATGAAGETLPLVAASLLIVCSFFAAGLDALGSTPFLRAVRAFERPQMAAVYRTYLDSSDLLPPLVYAVVLAFFGLGSVFVTLGIFCAICGFLAWRYLPKSM
jgi:MFS family permease